MVELIDLKYFSVSTLNNHKTSLSLLRVDIVKLRDIFEAFVKLRYINEAFLSNPDCVC